MQAVKKLLANSFRRTFVRISPENKTKPHLSFKRFSRSSFNFVPKTIALSIFEANSIVLRVWKLVKFLRRLASFSWFFWWDSNQMLAFLAVSTISPASHFSQIFCLKTWDMEEPVQQFPTRHTATIVFIVVSADTKKCKQIHQKVGPFSCSAIRKRKMVGYI